MSCHRISSCVCVLCSILVLVFGINDCTILLFIFVFVVFVFFFVVCFFVFVFFFFWFVFFFFFQAEDGIRDVAVTGVQTCALPICANTHKYAKKWWRYSLKPNRLRALMTSTPGFTTASSVMLTDRKSVV